MATYCPFMTRYVPTTISTGVKTATGHTGGSGDGTYWILDQINAGTDTPNYELSYVECMTTNCQIWDTVNSQCGMLTSRYLHNPNAPSPNNKSYTDRGLIQQMQYWLDIFEDTISSRADLEDSTKSLMVQFLNVIGKTADLELSGANTISLATQFLNVIGKTSQLEVDGVNKLSMVQEFLSIIGQYSQLEDDGAGNKYSLLQEFLSIIGKTSELELDDLSNTISLLKEFQNVIGKTEDLEENIAGETISLISEFINVIGKSSEREYYNDNYYSLIQEFQHVLGKVSEVDPETHRLLGSMMTTMFHIHYKHLHKEMANMKATTLTSEFLTNQDLDDGLTPGDSTGSIYGTDFMIEDETTEGEETCPPVLKAVHQHSNWKDDDEVPNRKRVLWSIYEQLIDPSHDHTPT